MDERSKRIIDTAIELATRDGYAAVRLREVAARAKVALGTVYKRFDSKEQILVAAMMQEGERLLTDFGGVPGETPAERAIGFFEVATSHFTRRPKLGKAILRAIAAGEGMTERVAAAREHFEKGVEWKGERLGVVEMRRHYANYFKGLRDFKQHRLQLVTLDGVDDIRAKLDELETIPFEPAV